MNLCGTIILFALAPLLCFGQNPDTQTSRKQPPSDREKSGLRGPVKTCVQEFTYLAITTSDGTQIPERTVRIETEYDEKGRLVSTVNHNSDGSSRIDRNTYASGKLLKTTWGKEGEPPAVTSYAYDDQGRLTSITDSSAPDNPTTFQYNERGRKTKVQRSRSQDYRLGVVVAGSPMQAADMPPNFQGGGTATTLYDQNDRPTEVRIRDARRRIFDQDETIETSYNEQGDVATEITRTLPGSNEPEQSLPAQNSEAHFAYKYDDHGNWTQKVTYNSPSPGAPFETTDTIRRTLTYF
jgi:hypothetical protein